MAINQHLKEIKKCISFIFIKNVSGQYVPNGTGFFIGVKNEANPDKYNVYLVSAKHVLHDEQGKLHDPIAIRLNKKDGTSQLIELNPLKQNIKIYAHSDPTVDIALFSYLPSQDVYDFKFLPDKMISNKETIEKNEISEGEEVFFSGLFVSHIGQTKNEPIIRFGKVSLIPSDKISWKEKNKPPQMLELYLMECSSFGGNSGSPVFFQLNPNRDPSQLRIGNPKIFLAGVMKGNFLNGSEVQTTAETANLYSLENVGIAAVVPSFLLHEILFSEEIKKDRCVNK